MTKIYFKHRFLLYGSAVFLTLGLSACGAENPGAQPGSSSSVTASSSSSPSSSPSTPGDSIGDASNGASLMAGALCSTCHTDNGGGEFGAPVAFNAATIQRGDTAAALASYISSAMPTSDSSLCVGDCANDIAAYLWSFRGTAANPGDNPNPISPEAGLGYVALPNGRDGYNYEPGALDESVGFDKAVSLEAFQETLYPHLRESGCGTCHNSSVAEHLGGNQAPMHSDNNLALAHEYALTRANFKDPKNSRFVVRMSIDRHNCPGSSCARAGEQMLAAVEAWKDRIEHMLPETPRGIAAGQNIGESQVEQWIADDRASLSAGDRQYIVYTSMHELHNEGLSADELDIVRVGLSKALNSVARWAPEIVNPTDVTGDGILYKFDIRDYWGYNQGVRQLFFGGSDDDMAFAEDGKLDYRGNRLPSNIQQQNYNFTNNTTRDPEHALRIWQRVLHGNVEGAAVNSLTLEPNIDGFKGARSRNDAGEYIRAADFEWAETAQLIYTLTRPDVYNAIMMNPFYAEEMERNLEVDISDGMDSYDYMITRHAITVDARLTWRAKRPNDGWYWKTWDIFTGQLASGRDRSINDVYDDPTGRDIRFPWWANPIPKFVDPLAVRDDRGTYSFIASLNQTFGDNGGFGFAGANAPGCNNQRGAVQGFGFCRNYTGQGGAMQSASEIIYSLDNGLQGYYLTGGFNQRRVDAFTNIVRDPRILVNAGDDIAHMTGYAYTNGGGGGFGGFARANDPRLNVGSSCIGCHIDGMNRASNDLRLWLDHAPERLPRGTYGVDGWIDDPETVARVKELYKADDYMKDVIENDRHGFLLAMSEIKHAMMWGADKNVYVEPIIWTVEYAQREKYRYPQTTSN